METDPSINTFDAPTPEHLAAHWGPNAPRGARAVLTRFVKEGANVPLFLGQTLVNALRDLGYNDTTSAICEHVDNAVQWGATEVRIYLRRRVGRGIRPSDGTRTDTSTGAGRRPMPAELPGDEGRQGCDLPRPADTKGAGNVPPQLQRAICRMPQDLLHQPEERLFGEVQRALLPAMGEVPRRLPARG